MADRITKKDAEQALRIYCERAGLPFGHYTTRKNATPEGALMVLTIEQSGRTFAAHLLARREADSVYVITGGLALACEYNGYQVQQIAGLDGTDPNRDGKPCTGVSTPFGGGIKTAREVYTMLRGAADGIELAEKAPA